MLRFLHCFPSGHVISATKVCPSFVHLANIFRASATHRYCWTLGTQKTTGQTRYLILINVHSSGEDKQANKDFRERLMQQRKSRIMDECDGNETVLDSVGGRGLSIKRGYLK